MIPKQCRPQLWYAYIRCRYFLLFPLYIGNEFECPFCGGHFRRLIPAALDLPVLKELNVVGGGYRSNALCPRCYSSDRERLIYLYIKNKTKLFQQCQKGIRVLHVAPERNLQKVFLQYSHVDYLSADLDSSQVMVKMDITHIDLDDNLFDVVICCHVLEHIPNDRKAMSELYRVLKPGGWAILQVPISLSLETTYEDATVMTPEEREKVFGKKDHVRIYGKDYKDRLEMVGFSVEVYCSAEELGESVINKYSLLRHENIYICSK